jgi:hypothetical protein
MEMLCRWRHHGRMKPDRTSLNEAIQLAAQQRVQRTLTLAKHLDRLIEEDKFTTLELAILREAAQELRALVGQ